MSNGKRMNKKLKRDPATERERERKKKKKVHFIWSRGKTEAATAAEFQLLCA